MSSSAPESDSAILLEDIFSSPSFPRNIRNPHIINQIYFSKNQFPYTHYKVPVL